MILKQFYLSCLSHASYFVADEKTKTAVVVDPQRDIDQYLEEAERLGVTIKYVLLTHFHADFIAGHLELQERVGAEIMLGAKAHAEYDHRPLADGDTLEIGDVRLEILETPGHTPEGISIVVYDLKQDSRLPHAVFTGDTLFVGDVGRPDLLASVNVSAQELGGWMYDSLHHKLMKLPDSTIVYPAHGAGSMCGKNLGSENSTTIGAQRAHNYALQPMSKSEFVELVASEQPEAPRYFAHDADLNRRKRATLQEALRHALDALSVEDVLRLSNAGATVIDVRDKDLFAAGHLAGSINIGLEGRLATWAGTVVPTDRKLVIVAEPGKEYEAAMRLGRIGIDGVVGYLDRGFAALDARPDLVARTKRVSANELASRLAADAQPLVLDVRTCREWEAGHVEGSRNIVLPHLAERAHELPRDRDVVVMCQSGYRSSLAVSQLQAQGFENVIDLMGGYSSWQESGQATVAPAHSGR